MHHSIKPCSFLSSKEGTNHGTLLLESLSCQLQRVSTKMTIILKPEYKTMVNDKVKSSKPF